MRRRWTVGLLLGTVLALTAFAILEGDLPEAVGDGAALIGHLLHRFGQAAAFGLLYLEESGVPMPMPGDVFVMYVGLTVRQPAELAGGLAWADRRRRVGRHQPLLSNPGRRLRRAHQP